MAQDSLLGCSIMGVFSSHSRHITLLLYILVAVATIFSLAPQLYSLVVNNAVMIVLTNELLESSQYRQTDRSLINVIPSEYFVHASRGPGIFASILRQWLAEPAPSWAVGRTALASGETVEARKALEPLKNAAAQNPFLYLDLLQSLDSGEAIKFFTSVPPPARIKPISDTMALAYATTSTEYNLEEARRFRTNDLSINYGLMMQASEDTTTRDLYAETVHKVTQSALDSTQPLLLMSTARLVPTLYKDGLWDFTTTRNVAKYLVWQYYFNKEVELMLTNLIRQDPEHSDWRLLLGELAERAQRYADAGDIYRQILATDTNNWNALTGLARSLLAEGPQKWQKSELLHLAGLLNSHYADMPDDVVTLDLLVSLYRQLESPAALQAQAELETLLDTKSVLSNLANPEESSMRLGPNLVQNADFGARVDNELAGFDFWSFDGPTGLVGAYAAGVDLLGSKAARLLNLRYREANEPTRPYAEYVSQDMTVLQGAYLVTVKYCTTGFETGSGLVYFGQNSRPDGLVLLHSEVPSDKDGCHLYRVIVDSSSEADSVRLVLRNWGDGDLRILEVGVQQVLESAQTK
jgi:tetratricopeptide (TPR) repeat protein